MVFNSSNLMQKKNLLFNLNLVFLSLRRYTGAASRQPRDSTGSSDARRGPRSSGGSSYRTARGILFEGAPQFDGRVARHDFKAFSFDAASGGHPLVARGVMLAERLDLLRQLDIPRDAFARFLLVLERAHPRQNPFHGAVHAALTVHAIDGRDAQPALVIGPDKG